MKKAIYQCSGDEYHLSICGGCKELKEITAWDLWTSNWKYAKRFFESKGNIKTRSRLKDEWCKNFNRSLYLIAMYPEIKSHYEESNKS